MEHTYIHTHTPKVCLDTPYFKGETTALFMESPLVDGILGNISGARDAQSSGINWIPTLAVHSSQGSG